MADRAPAMTREVGGGPTRHGGTWSVWRWQREEGEGGGVDGREAEARGGGRLG
jgi:hypothetical protein